MLHSRIEIEDPDIVQAIADFRGPAAELRERTKALAGMSAIDRRREGEEALVQEIMSRITVRAERIGLTADELLVFLNADASRTLGRAAPSSKALIDIVTARRADEATAHLELSAAQNKVRLATAARIAAETTYAKYAKSPL